MTSGTVEFRQTEYNLGDTLIADFTWTDAHWNFTAGNYVVASIYDPDGIFIKQHVEVDDNEGAATLSHTGTKIGTWRARLRIWNGTNWTDLSHYTKMVAEGEPPPEPPPEDPGAHHLIFNTTPGGCVIEIVDYGFDLSDSNGYAIFENLSPAIYEYNVSKAGYVTHNNSIFLGETKTRVVTLEAEGEPLPEPPPEAPNFWIDPEGWIQYFVITTLENLLGWTGSSFVGLLHQVKSFFGNSWTQIAAFFADVPGAIVQAVQDNLHNILVWQTTQLVNFFDWISTLTSTNFEALKDFLGDVGDFVGTAFTGFVDWLGTLTGTVAEYISSQVEGFLTWGEGLLTDIWEGIQGWVIDLIIGLIDSFNAGFDQGIEDQKNLRNEEEE